MALTCSLGATVIELVSYDAYISCGDACTCEAYELFCFRDTTGSGVYNLISETTSNAESDCSIPSCICNSNQANWNLASSITGKAESNKNTFPVLKPAAFEAAATSDPTSYEASVYTDLSSTNTRSSTVIHPTNSALFPGGTLPSFIKNTEPASCPVGSSVTCNYYYKMDWTFALSLSIDCIDFANDLACFGTFVCDCDNGYYSVAETMLTADLLPSATSSGASAAVKLVVKAAQDEIDAAAAAAAAA